MNRIERVKLHDYFSKVETDVVDRIEEDIIGEYKNIIGDDYEIIGMGSYINDEFNQDSDVDIDVLISGKVLKENKEKIDEITEKIKVDISNKFNKEDLVKIYVKPVEMYKDIKSFKSGTPSEKYSLDGYRELANISYLYRQAKTGRHLSGAPYLEIVEAELGPEDIPAKEGLHWTYIASRHAAEAIESGNHSLFSKALAEALLGMRLACNMSTLVTYKELLGNESENLLSLSVLRNIIHDNKGTGLLEKAYRIKKNKNEIFSDIELSRINQILTHARTFCGEEMKKRGYSFDEEDNRKLKKYFIETVPAVAKKISKASIDKNGLDIFADGYGEELVNYMDLYNEFERWEDEGVPWEVWDEWEKDGVTENQLREVFSKKNYETVKILCNNIIKRYKELKDKNIEPNRYKIFGDIYRSMGKDEEAIESYRNAVSSDPTIGISSLNNISWRAEVEGNILRLGGTINENGDTKKEMIDTLKKDIFNFENWNMFVENFPEYKNAAEFIENLYNTDEYNFTETGDEFLIDILRGWVGYQVDEIKKCVNEDIGAHNRILKYLNTMLSSESGDPSYIYPARDLSLKSLREIRDIKKTSDEAIQYLNGISSDCEDFNDLHICKSLLDSFYQIKRDREKRYQELMLLEKNIMFEKFKNSHSGNDKKIKRLPKKSVIQELNKYV